MTVSSNSNSTAIARNIEHHAAQRDPYTEDAPMPTSTELARQAAQGGGAVGIALRSQAAAILSEEQARAQIVPFLPTGVTFDEVILAVHRAASIEPKILTCTVPSIIQAVGTAVQTGLVIGKTIHLVPLYDSKSREMRLNAWTDYKGDIELVRWSGAARHVESFVVYEGDVFEYELGSNPNIVHKPERNVAKRGRIVGGYSVAYLNGSGSLKKIVYMPIEDIEKIRKNSKQWAPDRVKECPDWYVEKTLIHRNCKTLPRTQRTAAMLAIMDGREAADLRELDTASLDPSLRIGGGIGGSEAITQAPSPFAGLMEESAHEESEQASVAPDPAEAGPVRTAAWSFPMPFGENFKGKPIGELTPSDLSAARKWAEKKGTFPEFVAAVDELLEERRFAEESPL